MLSHQCTSIDIANLTTFGKYYILNLLQLIIYFINYNSKSIACNATLLQSNTTLKQQQQNSTEKFLIIILT